MKKILFFVAAVGAAAQAFSATPEQLDALLSDIQSDIAAKRLSSPEGNNALEKITEFRSEAPFDYRVVPLAYDWGEAYVALSQGARQKGELDKAQGYLDKVWKVAALTPGLEDEQRALDEALAQKGKPAVLVAAVEAPDAEEIERQRKLAEVAEKEKARIKIEAEKQRQLAAQEAVEKKRREAAEKAEREKRERERRAALAEAAAKKAEAERQARERAAASPVLASPVDLDDIALDVPVAKPKPVVKPVVKPKVAAKPSDTAVTKSTRLWAGAKEDSAALATYSIPVDLLRSKNRDIAERMQDICQVMVDRDASVVIHTESKSDYRWLAVRLTLCARRIDRGYRLRHSYQEIPSGSQPVVTLHPPRDGSLMEQ
ncbi:MAG: hypothetical protein VW258_07725 [Thalassolituus sp.]